MPFRARNAYYLKISERNVLPLYVYLDERHLDWMNDQILQHVLADLRPHIVPKLRAEADATQSAAGAKKLTVDTHRGDSYQFAYFLRKTHPHSVLVKTRHFVAAPPVKRTAPASAPPPTTQSTSKRKARPKAAPAPKRQKTKGKARADEDEELAVTSDEEAEDEGAPMPAAPRRSLRARKPALGLYAEDAEDEDMEEDVKPPPAAEPPNPETEEPPQEDVEMSEPSPSPPPPPQPSAFDLAADEEEEKPKPLLQLRYQGFSIYGHCLCVVVEPWPPMRGASLAPGSRAGSVAPSRSGSLAPFHQETSVQPPGTQRARTPLFLPDPDERRSLTPGPRGLTPAPLNARDGSAAPATSRDGSVVPSGRNLPPVPLFGDSNQEPLFLLGDEDEDANVDEDGSGMMALSQALHAAGDLHGTAAEDDEDMDGSIFFGDADEVREL
ncbi:uncharacterized protein SCHCODRAFT_02621872 [Schizophyllum commune H4-8]|nr:uncharacterized protein SCHCODRAFT_02621872 [Schizophyllum commune H4-8]KAI5893461.1 hypothetical protein SCHCODRAFT_02621872 [Schizophyllum commune H4-8]